MAETPRVIVTRPASEAQTWAAGLQAHGVRTEVLPLIQIAPLPDISAVWRVWPLVPHCLAVMFVSANAVRFFMAARPQGQGLQACRAWSTGPGTHAALLACGWPADQIDTPAADAGQFDSEALWSLVADRVTAQTKVMPEVTVLIVRGADAQGQMAGRDWLAQQLTDSGVQVQQTVAYVRQAPEWSADRHQLAVQAIQDGSWWLFSSSEAAQHLLQACPDLDLAHARALATHPRIAQRLREQGWGQVRLVPAELNAQAESIKSLP